MDEAFPRTSGLKDLKGELCPGPIFVSPTANGFSNFCKNTVGTNMCFRLTGMILFFKFSSTHIEEDPYEKLLTPH